MKQVVTVEATIDVDEVSDMKGNNYPFTIEDVYDNSFSIRIVGSPFMYKVVNAKGEPVEYELQNGTIYLK